MDEEWAMLAAQPEVLFTYPIPTGDNDKIGRTSLQDGVGRLVCFSPRDNHVKVVSVSIQRPRPDQTLASPGWAVTAASKKFNTEIHPKTLIEMWIICLDPVSANSEKCIGSR